MNRFDRAIRIASLAACVLILAVLAAYQAPIVAYYRYRPVMLLSEEAALTIGTLSGPARERTMTRLRTKNMRGVIFREETLEDLEQSGRAFVATGEEVIRLFKLQSVVSYYVYEQVRDKKLNPQGSYIFFSDGPVFERVYAELKFRLPPDSVKIYERGLLRGDASFPDNYILESTLSPSALRSVPLGWPSDHIRETLAAVRPSEGDTIWPVLWSDATSTPARRVTLDTSIPEAIELNPAYLRFPFNAIRIIYDPMELLTSPRSSDVMDLLSLRPLNASLILALGILLIIAAVLRSAPQPVLGLFCSSLLLVVVFTMLPSQKLWVAQGVVGLLPSAAMIMWMSSAKTFCASPAFRRDDRSAAGLLGRLMMPVSCAGWLWAALVWHFGEAETMPWSEYGLYAAPVLSAAFLIGVWAIEVSNQPVYPKHIFAGVELAAGLGILIFSASEYVLAAAAAVAWARWLAMAFSGPRLTVTETPGQYAALYLSAALCLKLYLTLAPLTASVAVALCYAAGYALMRLWRVRSSPVA